MGQQFEEFVSCRYSAEIFKPLSNDYKFQPFSLFNMNNREIDLENNIETVQPFFSLNDRKLSLIQIA